MLEEHNIITREFAQNNLMELTGKLFCSFDPIGFEIDFSVHYTLGATPDLNPLFVQCLHSDLHPTRDPLAAQIVSSQNRTPPLRYWFGGKRHINSNFKFRLTGPDGQTDTAISVACVIIRITFLGEVGK